MKTRKHLLYYTSHNSSSAHAKMLAATTKCNQRGNKKTRRKNYIEKGTTTGYLSTLSPPGILYGTSQTLSSA